MQRNFAHATYRSTQELRTRLELSFRRITLHTVFLWHHLNTILNIRDERRSKSNLRFHAPVLRLRTRPGIITCFLTTDAAGSANVRPGDGFIPSKRRAQKADTLPEVFSKAGEACISCPSRI